jgi:hypothetical protein
MGRESDAAPTKQVALTYALASLVRTAAIELHAAARRGDSVRRLLELLFGPEVDDSAPGDVADDMAPGAAHGVGAAMDARMPGLITRGAWLLLLLAGGCDGVDGQTRRPTAATVPWARAARCGC